MYLLGILFLHAATAALPVLPDPPTLPHSVAAGHEDSKIQTYIHNPATTSTPTKAKKDSEKAKQDAFKAASMVFPPPPQLVPYDYSILKKQKADQKRKYKDSVNHAENSKKEKESFIPEKPLKVEAPPNPETLSDSKSGFQDSKIRVNIPIVTSDSAPVADKKFHETVKNNMVKYPSILIRSPPELPAFDYSILKKQIADQKLKFNVVPNQQAQKSQKEKEAVILDLEKSIQVELPPKPATLIDSEARAIILSVTTDSVPEAHKNDDEEVKRNKVKIATVVRPPPPELLPFHYSNLRKQKSDQNPKSKSTKQTAKKEATILDLEKFIKVKVSLIPATWPSFVTAPQVSRSNISANVLGIATDSTPADKKNNEEVKHNIVKITTVLKPPPPELTPFDYSILRNQKAEHNLKSEYFAKQAAKKPKEEEETINLDLEKSLKDEETFNQTADSVAALPVSKVRMNTLNVATDAAIVDKKNNEEVKTTIGKIGLDVIPPPPELPLLDSSILQKHKSEQKQKSDDFLKQKVEKSKKVKEVLIIKKPVQVKVKEPKLLGESKLVGDSKPMVKSNPVEESKPGDESKSKEELIKESVKHSEDIPVTIKWTIPTAPFLSKLISNYPPLPSLGLNWPSQRPSKSRPPRIIYPKFDLKGIIHTN